MKKISAFLLLVITTICLFAFSSSASIVSEAGPIYLDEAVTVNFYCYEDEDTYETYEKTSEYFYFIPSTTKYYKIEIKDSEKYCAEIEIYDSNGKYIGSGDYDEFTGTESAIIKLKAKQKYYFAIEYELDYDESVNKTVLITEHSHTLKNSYISKADEESDGYIEKSCSFCDYETKEVIPMLNISVSKTKFTYNGKRQVPKITIKDTNNKTYKEGKDFTVKYPKSSTNVGYYDIEISMNNKYYYVYEYVSYEIKYAKLKSSDVKLDSTTISYGEKPKVTINNLKENQDYYVDFWCWGAGVTKITINGRGNYEGTVTKEITVLPPKISGLKASKKTSTSVTLSWKTDDEYATEYYQIYDVAKKKVIAKVSIYDAPKYTVKNLKAGKKYSFKVRGVATSDGEKYYGKWKTIEVYTRPGTTKISSIKSVKSKTIDLKWNKVSSATGYQIQYSTSSKMTNATTKTISKNSTTSQTIKSLKSGKKYYVRIRTYKTVNGSKIYSSWSSVKSVKTK